ncbi:small ribosomal subunit Rsm22 family protein [Gracilinema caldarium]|uniref:small ribosomal subunit Rsm22 family protein n=1 Tax=Gracilinema caldarium TaxID=215591 RepID=UPI0026F18E96|nr:small ribosomal subunit Rsm22 family protein [Gracilinema caldarium]
MTNLFLPLNEPVRTDLERLFPLLEQLFPIPGRFRARLPQDVAELSRQLTSERPRRDAGYLGQKALLSAYLHYFMPWNVFRLCRLLPALDIELNEGDAVTDLGSGPLTLPIALWMCRPDLRELPLEFRCLDRTAAILDAGKRIMQALPSQWKIRTIRGSLGERIEGKPAKLVTAINVFNELFWDTHDGPRLVAERYGPVLSALAAEEGLILIVEPGIPRSGEFISLMREGLLSLGRVPRAPCTHSAACPLPGGRRGAKWCHFAFDTDEAPEALHRLSRAAGLPKERATMSFLLAGPPLRGFRPDAAGKAEPAVAMPSLPAPAAAPAATAMGATASAVQAGSAAIGHKLAFRVLSDPFPLGDKATFSRGSLLLGRYACSEKGLVLLRGQAGRIQGLAAGAYAEVQGRDLQRERDKKSGAQIINLM